MKVIICGAGQVGWQIARHLSGERNDVTVVDTNPELVRLATEALDVGGVVGHASYPDVLERAGARDADMMIAATHSDEVNMVTCQVAHSVFSIRRKIARIRSQSYLNASYSDLYRREHMPIDVIISPEREVAEAALQRLMTPSAFDTEYFMDDQARLLGVTIDAECPVVNTPLRQLTELFPTLNVVVVGLRREGRLFVPSSRDQIYAGDECYVCVATPDVDRTLKVFGKNARRPERVVVVGGGNVGLAVAQALENSASRVRVKVIERNREQAERVADTLDRTIVLNGDGLDAGLLTEANVVHADAVLAVTDDDKTNMLAAVRAKAMGCPMAICLINDPTLVPLMAPLGVDAYINPRASTVSSILRHIRHGRVRGVYSIGDAEAEVIEAQVLGTSPFAGQRIGDLNLPEGVLIGAIQKAGVMVKPESKCRIEEGDVMLLFCMTKDVPEVERLLQVSIDFF